ncbi:MAG: glutamate 5-kinase [Ruminococcaceae bacterium]|nr:glutamate 5-kinase [Oscillospiraceae bacterium]
MKINTENIKRVVVKVGTSTLTHTSGYINIRKVERLVSCLSDLHNSGMEIILVSSGAVSCGLAKIGFDRKTLSTEQKQAAAAVGQCQLIDMYDRRFSDFGITIAQILLTRSVIDNKERRLNASTTLELLIGQRIIPIVNENDTLSNEQIKIGSNDTLAASVARLCNADLLINMSDIDGLYDSDPRSNKDARFIEYVEAVTDEIFAMGAGAGTARGTGGMATKLESAKYITERGIAMIILNGADPEILYNVFDGEFVGTYFAPQKQ